MEITPVTEIELPAQTLSDHTNVRAKMVMMEMEKHALLQVSGDYCLTAGKKSINAKKNYTFIPWIHLRRNGLARGVN